MTDRIERPKRSWNMSQIRSKNTGPELVTRRLLHKMGFRFRLHRKDLPGRPDITLSKYKTIIFVHGCFWHRHAGCKYAYVPKSNVAFWKNKLNTNVLRDNEAICKLERAGWNVIIIWECQTRNPEILLQIISSTISR
jgi:DNA mismatch endonuclease, patch repair protein